jgi:rod shape determining protein RodA
LALIIEPLVLIGIALAVIIFVYFRSRLINRNWVLSSIIFVMIGGFVFSVDYVFENVFKQHHRDRFNILLGKEVDMKGIGYNTNQSEIAIGSGGWFGKGYLEGTQTKGGFVPEQHTDYIFTTVGEEWGFLGSLIVISLFVILIIRIIYLSERQKTKFSRVYGYCVAGILFIHFFVNIAMVVGIFPTIGVPLPFFSYGGSGLWGFTILLFIFLKMDANKVNEW